MAERKCDNWLLSFRDWTIPRSEAPETFIFWTGLYTLASVMKRRVCVPKKLLGSWTCYPHLYAIFVSPPGIGRKTTTMEYADDLLENVPNINTVAQAITAQKLIKKLADLNDCSVSIRATEFGTFINPSGNVMIDLLTSLFDGKKRFDSDTLTRGLEFSENPSVNLLAATTPKWISENLSEVMVGGGFTSRVVFVYEETVRRLQMFYESIDHDALNAIKQRLIADLIHLSSNVEGEFEFDVEAKEYVEEWYLGVQKEARGADSRVHGYYQRKPAHALKIAMLLHLSYSDELTITLKDFEMAEKILTGVEKKMIKVFQTVGKNPYTETMDSILDYIRAKVKVPRRELLSRFYHAAPPEILTSLIGALIDMGKLQAVGTNPGDLMYSVTSPKSVPTSPAHLQLVHQQPEPKTPQGSVPGAE